MPRPSALVIVLALSTVVGLGDAASAVELRGRVVASAGRAAPTSLYTGE